MLHDRLRRVQLLAAGTFLSAAVSAQSPTSGSGAQPSEKAQASAVKESGQQATAPAESDGSLTYIGKRLWFEVRKRLNLTTEQEEKQQRAAEALVRLKVGGFRIEQQAPAREAKAKE